MSKLAELLRAYQDKYNHYLPIGEPGSADFIEIFETTDELIKEFCKTLPKDVFVSLIKELENVERTSSQ